MKIEWTTPMTSRVEEVNDGRERFVGMYVVGTYTA